MSYDNALYKSILHYITLHYIDACVGLNWLLVSFLSHVNKNIIHSFIHSLRITLNGVQTRCKCLAKFPAIKSLSKIPSTCKIQSLLVPNLDFQDFQKSWPDLRNKASCKLLVTFHGPVLLLYVVCTITYPVDSYYILVHF